MYVGITSRLLNDVQYTVNRMAQNEKKSLPGVDLVYTTPPDWAHDTMWAEYGHLRTQMPKRWKQHWSNITIGSVKYKGYDFSISVSFDPPIEIPPGASTYDPAYKPKLRMTDAFMADPLVIAHLEYRVTQAEQEKRWAKVGSDVRTFLVSAKSLNQALKLWPDVRVYIPQEFLIRVGEKAGPREKSNAEEVLKSIDVDGAMTAAVIARLSEDK